MQLSEAASLSRGLMNEFGLGDWVFQWDRARARFGRCNYARKLISLSSHLTSMNEEAEVSDCIRHEIAHALAGPGAGHGPKWKAQCRITGARPERCYSRTKVVTAAPFYLVCPREGCSTRQPRYRKTRSRYSCKQCGTEVVWERAAS